MTETTGAARWTGYRPGALLVDKTADRLGVSHAFDGEKYTLAGIGTTERWTAPARAIRLATDEERRALGLGPRSVD
ncbi:hypothetical protein [Streptomyces olivoreticuli]|uniref:hypothetical protein n=1 Tax=Streptomyces olivoreticuli TaxID=68246 RepID=UPI000E24BD0E|nr:hypothetical protein [Streptomyces olivoreticuli]